MVILDSGLLFGATLYSGVGLLYLNVAYGSHTAMHIARIGSFNSCIVDGVRTNATINIRNMI